MRVPVAMSFLVYHVWYHNCFPLQVLRSRMRAHSHSTAQRSMRTNVILAQGLVERRKKCMWIAFLRACRHVVSATARFPAARQTVTRYPRSTFHAGMESACAQSATAILMHIMIFSHGKSRAILVASKAGLCQAARTGSLSSLKAIR